MMVLVSYDIGVTSPGGKRRLRRVARECTNYGQRVQCSVFECVVDPAQWVQLKNAIEKIIDPAADRLRYYHLGANWKPHVEHVGAKPSLDLDEPLIV